MDTIKDIIAWVMRKFWLIVLIGFIIFSAIWYRTNCIDDDFTWSVFLEEIGITTETE